MRKIYILLLFSLFFISGCENQEETTKNQYIAMKSEIMTDENYTKESLNVDIITTIERIDEENINYKTVINNPKENMHNIKVLLVHNYYSEDIFPSIGIFDESQELLVNSSNETELVLEGVINTTQNISKLDLELKLLIEYIDDNGEKKDIYYKTT